MTDATQTEKIFDAMLLGLRSMTATDKGKVLKAIETKRTPTEPDLAGFYTVYRHATAEEQKRMLDALNQAANPLPSEKDATSDGSEITATMTLFKLVSKSFRDHIAAALDTGFDSLTKEELYLYGQFAALVTATEGEHDEELSNLFGITLESIAALRASELASPPEQEDFFYTSQEQKREEARKKLSSGGFMMAQRDGYNSIRRITPKNTEPESVYYEGEQSVKMERTNRKGFKSSVIIKKQKPAELTAKLNAEELTAKRWNVRTKMTLDFAVIKLTEQSKTDKHVVAIPLEEWCKLRGKATTKSSIDHEREAMKESLNTLYDLSLEWGERGKGGKRDFHLVHPFPEVSIKNNVAYIGFSPSMADYFLSAPVRDFRKEILSLDERKPNAYLIATKLDEHANMNPRSKTKPFFILSVDALLDVTDFCTKENAPNRRYRDFIINPFLNAMKEIEDKTSLIWSFSDKGGKPLKEGIMPTQKIDDFLGAYIKYSFSDIKRLTEGEKS